MKLLLLSVTYYPDKKSASFMLKTLAEQLISLNNSVTVITFSSSIKSKQSTEIINDVKVIRLKVGNPGFSRVKRALIELTYSWRIKNLLNELKDLEFDGVIYYSPSIFFGKAVKYIKKRWNIPAYLIVRDIFPDWLVKIGQMKKGLIYYFFKVYERKSFLAANSIGMESAKDIFYAKKIIQKKDIHIEHLLNWFSDSETSSITSHQNSIISKDKINLIYGGSLGLAQDIEGFLSQLEKSDLSKNLRVIIIGDGERRAAISVLLETIDLDLKLVPTMKRSEYLELVKKSDGGIVCLDKNLVANNYPGKSFDYMFFSKPLFCYFNANNEFGSMVKDCDFGYVIEAGNRESVDINLELFINDSNLRKQRGKNSKDVLHEYFSVRRAALQIEATFPEGGMK